MKLFIHRKMILLFVIKTDRIKNVRYGRKIWLKDIVHQFQIYNIFVHLDVNSQSHSLKGLFTNFEYITFFRFSTIKTLSI